MIVLMTVSTLLASYFFGSKADYSKEKKVQRAIIRRRSRRRRRKRGRR